MPEYPRPTPSALEAAQAARASAEAAADALRVSELRYRRLFEAARDGILILDSQTGMVIDANPFMAELLGYSHDEFLGKELWEIGLLRDKQTSQEAFQKLQRESCIRYENLPLETGYSASKAAVTNWAGGLAAAAKEHGIAVFAWDPGFVRTAMSEFLAESDEVRRWFGDTFQQWFETGQDIPIERSVGQFMLLASGRLDALSGRQLRVEQELLDLANRAAEIERDDLLTLRLRT